MLRRAFVTSAAGLAALSASKRLWARDKPPRVGIIGCGIVGASIAMHLARAGADVTVFEKTAPATGASGKSLAWINPVVLDAHYRDLRLLSMQRWRALNGPLGLGVTWGGSISWALDVSRGDNVRARAAMLRGTADDPKMLADAQALTAQSPAIHTGDITAAFFAPIDGHVEAPVATFQFIKEAKRRGAKLLYPCEVQGIDLQGGRLVGVTTSQGKFALDHLISASGIDTPRVMAMAGHHLGLLHSPGLVVHTTPLPPLTRMAYDASGVLEFKQMRDGRVAASYSAGPPDAPQHVDIRDHVMTFPSEALQKAHGDSVLRKTVAYMPGAAGATPQKVMLCFRPMPMDKMPVVGAVPGAPGVYVVVTHSGVTLAPILGQYVAQEVLTGVKAPMLAPYRPERFAQAQRDAG